MVLAESRFMLGPFPGPVCSNRSCSRRRQSAARNSQNPHPFCRNRRKDGPPEEFQKMHGLESLATHVQGSIRCCGRRVHQGFPTAVCLLSPHHNIFCLCSQRLALLVAERNLVVPNL